MSESHKNPNVIVFFTDQQRWDTTGLHGNPMGLTPNLDRLAREHTQDAIKTLVKIMNSTKAPPAARVAAANSILDRGYGKPAQDVTVTQRRLVEMTDAEILSQLDGILQKKWTGDEPKSVH